MESMFVDAPFSGYSESGRAQVLYKAQEKMKKGGFYSSGIDGKPGKGTHKAIKAYQTANSLPASGRLDGATLSAMGLNEMADNPSWRVASTSRSNSPRKSSKSSDRTPESEKTLFRKQAEKILGKDLQDLNPFRKR